MTTYGYNILLYYIIDYNIGTTICGYKNNSHNETVNFKRICYAYQSFPRIVLSDAS